MPPLIGVALLIVLIALFLAREKLPSLPAIHFFEIDNIKCKTQFGPCGEKDEERLAEFEGESFFSLSEDAVGDELKKDFRNRRVFTEKVFPNTLVVVVEKRKPIIALEEKEGFFLLDQDGTIIDFGKDSPLPKMSINNGPDSLVVGEKVGEEEKKAADILYLTSKSQKVLDSQMADRTLTLELENEVIAYYPLDQDPQVLVGALQLIIARSRIEGRFPKSIDLRYSNPVLKY